MKITGLKIDGFGAWTGLTLESLGDGLNVLYGPNEAGKTTLLQFIRSALYGFSPARRRYFPPRHGGEPGGSIDLGSPNGRFQLRRHTDAKDPARGERVALVAADGTLQGEHLVKTLLCDVDEATYNNVFAVGLQEIQQLGTLSDTEAAELLYGLSVGLDRVSLVEVMRELEASRNRILDAGGGPSLISQLLQQRERLRLELEELGKLTRHYGRLAAEQNQIQREVARLEEETQAIHRQARVFELAISLRERWDRRASLDEELAALGPAGVLPPGALEQLDTLNARLQQHREAAEQSRRRREQLRAEAKGLAVNEPLWRQAARIEALGEQGPWIAGLQKQIGELESEMSRLQSDLAAQQQQLGLGTRNAQETLAAVAPRRLARLRAPSRAMRRDREHLAEAEQQAATARTNADALAAQISAALAQRNRTDLAAALDEQGGLVAQLRRRAQIDERLDQMKQYQAELEQQSRHLLDRQLLPIWVLLGLGTVFVVGVVLIMAGLFIPTSITGSVGWAMALVGLGGSGLAVAGKIMLERSNTKQLDACQKHIAMLQLQIRQAQEEAESLDAQLSRGALPAGQLHAAERELAALEELVPLDARRTAAEQEAQAAAGRAVRAKEQLAAGQRQWRDALASVGLPHDLAPRQVREVIRRGDQIGRMCRQLEQRGEELSRRRREVESLATRIAQLASDAQTRLDTPDPVAQLRQLADALGRQEALIQRRRELGHEARSLKSKQRKHQQAANRLKHRRHDLLREAGAQDEREFRQRAVEAARGAMLRQERESLAREIAAALTGVCPEDTLAAQLDAGTDASLAARRGQLLARHEELDKALKQRFQQRGQLDEQMKTLAENRELPAKRLELATIEKRLDDAVARWQLLAVTHRALETIRAAYETERQPETLKEASGYLNRLTQGRYRRVWTPLGEDVLLVDDAQGEPHAVEALSRGTREQLFLSLRLALASSYARRGAPLPLVLDDVLVNFDAGRAKAAATVLRDFAAAAGHQVLVFTCHEHITKMFRAMKVPVNQLPDNTKKDHGAIEFAPSAEGKAKDTKKSKKQKEPKRPAARAAEPAIPPRTNRPNDDPPDDEIRTDREIDEEEAPDRDDTRIPLDDAVILQHPEQPSPWQEQEPFAARAEDAPNEDDTDEEDLNDKDTYEVEPTDEDEPIAEDDDTDEDDEYEEDDEDGAYDEEDEDEEDDAFDDEAYEDDEDEWEEVEDDEDEPEDDEDTDDEDDEDEEDEYDEDYDEDYDEEDEDDTAEAA